MLLARCNLLPVEIHPIQDAIVLRARGSELLILADHVAELKKLKSAGDFSRYFLHEALVNRPARKLFEAWLRKDGSLWARIYKTVQTIESSASAPVKKESSPVKATPKAEQTKEAAPKSEKKSDASPKSAAKSAAKAESKPVAAKPVAAKPAKKEAASPAKTAAKKAAPKAAAKSTAKPASRPAAKPAAKKSSKK
jgi:hypothetical protein